LEKFKEIKGGFDPKFKEIKGETPDLRRILKFKVHIRKILISGRNIALMYLD